MKELLEILKNINEKSLQLKDMATKTPTEYPTTEERNDFLSLWGVCFAILGGIAAICVIGKALGIDEFVGV
jgi:hypothetical protein